MMLARPSDLLQFAGIQAKHRVADFGVGSGLFTEALLDRVGEEGRVYALDALPQALESIRHRAQAVHKKCMTICTEFESVLPLKENLLDVAILANTLHAIDPFARARFIAELARVIVPGGRALIVDWAGSFKNMGPPPSLIVTPAEAVRLFRGQGFATSDMLAAGTHQYAFIATLPRLAHQLT